MALARMVTMSTEFMKLNMLRSAQTLKLMLSSLARSIFSASRVSATALPVFTFTS